MNNNKPEHHIHSAGEDLSHPAFQQTTPEGKAARDKAEERILEGMKKRGHKSALDLSAE